MLNLIKQISKKPRVAGTKECDRIRDILVEDLQSSGHKTRIQKRPFTGWEVVEKPELELNGKKVKVLPVAWTGSTRGTLRGILKETSRIKTFEAYEWLRYKIVDKNNKTRGYVITRPDIVWGQLIDRKSKLPYFMIPPDAYRKIKDKKDVKVEASVKSRFIRKQHIYNIITKNSSGKKIVVCAHYDSFPGAPGANDNASGVSTLMEIAKTNRDLQYILFSAEEWNKYGAYSYVKSLKKEQLKKIKLLINLDMIGHGKPYCICSKRLKNKVRKLLPKSVEVIPKPRPPFDFWPFCKKGVDIVHFGATPYKYCHSPQDTASRIQLKPMKAVVKYVNRIVGAFKG